MYIYSAYLNDSLLNYKDDIHPLSILSCGQYRLSSDDKLLPTLRPKGRLDYQLIYIASGVAHFYFGADQKETIVSAGTFILFQPKEYQKYTYYGSEHTEAFWIHFSGHSVKKILKSCGIPLDKKLLFPETHALYADTFKQIINEINQKDSGYEMMIELLFKRLLLLISRNCKSDKDHKESFAMKEAELAMKYFQEHYHENISIEEYAASRGMSISWFIRIFKEYASCTPLQYILSRRIINAQTLLESTDYSINEISNIVGYDNQLYFSRLFTKQKGMSPQKYRNAIRENK